MLYTAAHVTNLLLIAAHATYYLLLMYIILNMYMILMLHWECTIARAMDPQNKTYFTEYISGIWFIHCQQKDPYPWLLY